MSANNLFQKKVQIEITLIVSVISINDELANKTCTVITDIHCHGDIIVNNSSAVAVCSRHNHFQIAIIHCVEL